MSSLKYQCKDATCSVELCIRHASAMAKINRTWQTWQSSTISFKSKFKLSKSLVASILFGCETWTLLANSEKRIQAFEIKRLRKVLRISHSRHKTTSGCRVRSTSLWANRNLIWQPSRDRNSHGSCMSHTMTVPPKLSFRTPWRWATP